MLSQWRAYAQDGRGGAITLDRRGLDAIVYRLPGLRINPVFYSASQKTAFVNGATRFELATPCTPCNGIMACCKYQGRQLRAASHTDNN